MKTNAGWKIDHAKGCVIMAFASDDGRSMGLRIDPVEAIKMANGLIKHADLAIGDES